MHHGGLDVTVAASSPPIAPRARATNSNLSRKRRRRHSRHGRIHRFAIAACAKHPYIVGEIDDAVRRRGDVAIRGRVENGLRTMTLSSHSTPIGAQLMRPSSADGGEQAISMITDVRLTIDEGRWTYRLANSSIVLRNRQFTVSVGSAAAQRVASAYLGRHPRQERSWRFRAVGNVSAGGRCARGRRQEARHHGIAVFSGSGLGLNCTPITGSPDAGTPSTDPSRRRWPSRAGR